MHFRQWHFRAKHWASRFFGAPAGPVEIPPASTRLTDVALLEAGLIGLELVPQVQLQEVSIFAHGLGGVRCLAPMLQDVVVREVAHLTDVGIRP